jgi:hypothetical protein
MDANSAADGEYDFEFKLFDDANTTTGVQQGNAINGEDVDVIDGYFTVELDFGAGVFDGDAVWLETAVRPSDSNDPNAFVTLSPRQEIGPTPYALYAASGPGVPFPLELSGSVDYPESVIKGTNTGNGYGVYGKHESNGNFGYLGGEDVGVYGYSGTGYAGDFNGKVKINGRLTVTDIPYGNYGNVQWNYATHEFYYDNSSKRFKENIGPIEDDFGKILGVTPKTYTRPGNPDRWEVGYIAEEFVEAGLEKLVWFEDEEHTIPDGINYEKIILYTNEIVKENRQAIHELQAQVAKQQAAKDALIAAQQAKIADLQEQLAQFKLQLGKII